MTIKKTIIAHILTSDPDEGMEWLHNDWFYKIVLGEVNSKRVGKLYRSRSAASRAAKKIANEIKHWYPI